MQLIRRILRPTVKLISVIGVLVLFKGAWTPVGMFILDDSPTEYTVKTSKSVEADNPEGRVAYSKLSETNKELVDDVVEKHEMTITKSDTTPTFTKYEKQYVSWTVVVEQESVSHIIRFSNTNPVSSVFVHALAAQTASFVFGFILVSKANTPTHRGRG